jgi:hypothetical protein
MMHTYTLSIKNIKKELFVVPAAVSRVSVNDHKKIISINPIISWSVSPTH